MVGLRIEMECSPLIVELNIVPIYHVTNFFMDLSIGTSGVDRREPGGDRGVSDDAVRKVLPEGLSVGDKPLFGFAIGLVDGIHV